MENNIQINIEDMTELGRGACSVVYKYDDTTVVKLFNESGKKMFTPEAFSQLVGLSNSTCVFPRQEISIDGEFAGYSMEYVKGQKLHEIIDTLDIQTLIDSIKKVEIDLQALSKEKVLFQDVNQGNIMWDEQNGCIKIIDTDFFERSENVTEQQCYSNNLSSFNNILEMELGMLNGQGSKLSQFLHNNPEFNKLYRKYTIYPLNGKNISVTELIQKAVEIIENEYGTKCTTFAEINQILPEQAIDLEQEPADVPIFEPPSKEQKDVEPQKVGFKQRIADMLSKNTLLRKIPFIDRFVKEQESLLLPAAQETPTISECQDKHQEFVNRLSKNGEYRNLPVGQQIKSVMRDAIEAAKEDYKKEMSKFKELEPHSMAGPQKMEQMRRKMDGKSLEDDL